MILAIDVYYIDDKAKSVGIIFEQWDDSISAIKALIIDYQDNINPYQSGQFFQRELPCILSLLSKIDLDAIATIVIDGYVYLNDGNLGLGAHLYQALNQKIPIVGVAKKIFSGNRDYVMAVSRGKSKHPLYVTAIGTSVELAAENLQLMAGKYRMPDLLSYLDQQTKLFKHEYGSG